MGAPLQSAIRGIAWADLVTSTKDTGRSGASDWEWWVFKRFGAPLREGNWNFSCNGADFFSPLRRHKSYVRKSSFGNMNTARGKVWFISTQPWCKADTFSNQNPVLCIFRSNLFVPDKCWALLPLQSWVLPEQELGSNPPHVLAAICSAGIPFLSPQCCVPNGEEAEWILKLGWAAQAKQIEKSVYLINEPGIYQVFKNWERGNWEWCGPFMLCHFLDCTFTFIFWRQINGGVAQPSYAHPWDLTVAAGQVLLL